MPKKRQLTDYAPIDLLNMLTDSCLHRLKPGAWKVVSYVARQTIRQTIEEWESRHNPVRMLQRDIKRMWPKAPYEDQPPDASQMQEVEEDFGTLLTEDQIQRGVVSGRMVQAPPRWVTSISLEEFCKGTARHRDRGTGLSKTTVIAGIKEAAELSILGIRPRKDQAGRDKASVYWIAWDRVAELDRTQRRRKVSKRRKKRVSKK